MPQRPCLTCGVLVESGSYCPKHTPSRFNPKRGSGPARARWRREVLERAGHRCERCGASERLEAHHVIGLEEGGAPLEVSNGQCLCEACHREVERGRCARSQAVS